MANDKKKPDKASDSRRSYTGRDIDQKTREKVDSYMDPASGRPEKAKPGGPSGATGPPLLPTDKIPPSVADAQEAQPADDSEAKAKLPSVNKTGKQPYTPAYDEWPDPEEARRRGLDLEDSATSKAVDEIVAAESDKLLETEDKAIAEKQQEAEPESKRKGRFRSFIKSKRFILIFWTLAIALAAAMAVPASRYFVLNTLGVRASTSMRVVDAKTGQPLKNVEVSLDGQASSTGIDGEARVYDIKLGKQTLSIKKPAFAGLQQEVTIGWGSNPLGDMELKPVGAQYHFILSDYLSGKAIKGAEAISGDANAVADAKGRITLVVEKTDQETREVTLRAGGYRNEKIKVSPDKQELRKINMVPSRKHAFISKRSGTYDLYKSYIDGKGEKLVLAGSGKENEDGLILVNHPTDEVVAFVSVRGEAKSSTGELLSTLQAVDLNTDATKEVVSANRIQIIDWVGERLVYIKEQADKNPDDPTRHKLMSYDYKSGTEITLSGANYFNDASVAQGTVYYSPAGGKTTGFYRVAVDGSAKTRITDKEVWNIFRTTYNNLRVSLGQQWYDYNLPDGSFNKADGPPSVLQSHVYYDSPDRKKSIWSEDRDGKGTLILFTHETNEDEVIFSKSGIKNPLRWLSDKDIIFRISNGQETADYAMSLGGGQPKKIVDATNVTGIDRWYFY